MRSRQGSFGLLAVVSILLASGAAFMAPDFAAAQYNAGPRMSAPSINISPVGPRSPDFRTPPGSGGGTYTTQSSTGTPSKDSTLPRQTKKKTDTATAPTTGVPRQISGIPPTGERRFANNEFIIEVPGRPTEQAANALAQRHRLTRVESFNIGLTGTTLFRWTLPDGDGRSMRQVIQQLEADPNIKIMASPNYLHMLQQTQAQKAGDPAQYTLDKLQLKLAHGLATGAQIKVAVIDSGIDATHPELAGTIAGMLDTLEPGEPHTHGTAIAGAIVAQSRLMGVAPRAQILAVRAFDPAGGGAEGTTFNILKGFNWAVANGARVINMSFAGPHDPAMARVLAAARNKGIVLIAAAGNAGPKSPPLYPAADPNVIAVTATDAEDKLFLASNRGNHVAVSAPGVDILLPSPGASYQVSSGTSFAAAHVSGIAALILERKPGLGQDSVRRILLSTAKDLGPKGRDRDFGVGLADAYQAVLAAEGRTVDSVAQGTSATR